jgi:hypothetical protein
MVFNKAEYMKEYQIKNKLRIKTRRAKHRIDNIEHYKQMDQNQYYKNQEFNIQRKSKYARDNPDIVLKCKQNYLAKEADVLETNLQKVRYLFHAWGLVVKRRDGLKCTWCDESDLKKLRAHHIIHKIYCTKEEALDPDNGITLCHECHKEQHRLDRSLS